MDSRIDRPLVTRARMLLLAALAAGFWIVLTVFGIAGSAEASDSQGPGDSLLGAVVGTLGDETPVPALLEQIEPSVAVLSEAAADAATATLTIAESATQPILEQPVVADSLGLLGGAATVVLPAPGAHRLTEAPAAPAATASAPAAPVKAREAIATEAGANQQHDTADPPLQPAPAPFSSDAAALGQGSGSPLLMAALLGSPASVKPLVRANSQQNDVLPSSPPFDNDSSPD